MTHPSDLARALAACSVLGPSMAGCIGGGNYNVGDASSLKMFWHRADSTKQVLCRMSEGVWNAV